MAWGRQRANREHAATQAMLVWNEKPFDWAEFILRGRKIKPIPQDTGFDAVAFEKLVAERQRLMAGGHGEKNEQKSGSNATADNPPASAGGIGVHR